MKIATFLAAVAAIALSLAFSSPQGGGGQAQQPCPCDYTVNTVKSPDSDCEVVWAETIGRGGQCPRDSQDNCTVMGSLGCQANGSIFEITCGGSKQVSMVTQKCQDVDSAAMVPSDDENGAPHFAYLNCADCSP